MTQPSQSTARKEGANHTPLPWQYTHRSKGPLCFIHQDNPPYAAIATDISPANAALIVEAVNNYAALRAQLEEAQRDAKRLDWLLDRASVHGGGNGADYSIQFRTPVDTECDRQAIDAAMEGSK